MSAKAGRSDLDAMLKISSVPANEPVFLLRAQDFDAEETVHDWVARAHRRGVDVAVLEQALRQADRMHLWPTKKAPDAGHLGAGERNRLEHAFDRRAWRAHLNERGMPSDKSIEIAYAERRGYAQAMAELRMMAQALEATAISLDFRIAATAKGGLAENAELHRKLVLDRDVLVTPALAKAEANAAAEHVREVAG